MFSSLDVPPDLIGYRRLFLLVLLYLCVNKTLNYLTMAQLVPVIDRRAAVVGAGLYHLGRNLDQIVPMARNVVGAFKRSYTRAFGQSRTSRSRYGPKRRFSMPSRRRYVRRRRYTRPNQLRVRRFRGRRTYGNRSLTLRSVRHIRHSFTQDTAGDLVPELVENDAPGVWVPSVDEIDELQQAKFDNCASKRIVSVHVYLKNIKYSEDRTGDPDSSVPLDTRLFTYANVNALTMNTSPNNHYMMSNGVPAILTRLQRKYHSIVRAPCYAREMTKDTLATLNTLSWKNSNNIYNLFNRTGAEDALSPRVNIDYQIVPENLTCATSGVTGCLKYELVVATKWRLYGSKNRVTF